jgi:hypothetical protein
MQIFGMRDLDIQGNLKMNPMKNLTSQNVGSHAVISGLFLENSIHSLPSSFPMIISYQSTIVSTAAPDTNMSLLFAKFSICSVSHTTSPWQL